MILYYAMGGGLGHLTRSIAILQAAPQLTGQVRILASSYHAELTVPYAPCPVDVVSGDLLCSRRRYLDFLEDYLGRHCIEQIVLDAFPFGLVGEWQHLDARVPRLLIARNLKWTAYQARVGVQRLSLPHSTLLLEPLDASYQQQLQQECDCTQLAAPIVLPKVGNMVIRSSARRSCVVIHSGDEAEQHCLLKLACNALRELGEPEACPDHIFPGCGIYPAERYLAEYRMVVSGAGYNMTAAARLAPPGRRHLLHPFERRFDDQHARVRHFQTQRWTAVRKNGAQEAAQWLLQHLNDSWKEYGEHRRHRCLLIFPGCS